MSIILQCPGCRKNLKSKDDLAGKRVKCPACGHLISVPVAQTALQPIHPSQEKPAVENRPKRSSRRLIWIVSGASIGALILLTCVIGILVLVFSKTPKDQIIGKWQSKDDSNYIVEFTNQGSFHEEGKGWKGSGTYSFAERDEHLKTDNLLVIKYDDAQPRHSRLGNGFVFFEKDELALVNVGIVNSMRGSGVIDATTPGAWKCVRVK